MCSALSVPLSLPFGPGLSLSLSGSVSVIPSLSLYILFPVSLLHMPGAIFFVLISVSLSLLVTDSFSSSLSLSSNLSL